MFAWTKLKHSNNTVVLCYLRLVRHLCSSTPLVFQILIDWINRNLLNLFQNFENYWIIKPLSILLKLYPLFIFNMHCIPINYFPPAEWYILPLELDVLVAPISCQEVSIDQMLSSCQRHQITEYTLPWPHQGAVSTQYSFWGKGHQMYCWCRRIGYMP